MNITNKFILLIVGLVCGTFLLGMFIVGAEVYKIKADQQSISVTGQAQKTIKSDVVIWKMHISRTTDAFGFKNGYTLMKGDLDKVLGFLKQKGIAVDQIQTKPLNVVPLYQNPSGSYGGYWDPVSGQQVTGQIAGYNFTQEIQVESSDVDTIAQISQETGVLLQEGILFNSAPLEFYYSKLADVKQEMLAQATKDAYTRAQSIAGSANSSLAGLQSASQGVFQITAVHSTEVSDYGLYDTSAIEKQITALIRASFIIR